MSNVVFEKQEALQFSSTKQTWISAGVRPYWFFHQNGRLVVEGGFDHVDDEFNDTTYWVKKGTVALEAALEKGIWKRPVLRLYYTHADWSSNATGLIGTDYYAHQSHGDNLGVQVEYWW